MDCWLFTIGLGGLILAFLIYATSEYLTHFKKRGFPQMEMSVAEVFTKLIMSIFKLMNVEKILEDLYKRTDGQKYAGVFFLGSPMIMIRDPDLINLVTIKDFSHFTDRTIPGSDDGDLITGGLLGVKGDVWRWQRYKLAPTFTSGKLKSMFSQIIECSDDIISYLGKKSGSKDVKMLTSSFSLNVIGSVAFGIKANAQHVIEGGKNKFVEMSQRIFAPTYKQTIIFVIAMMFPKLSKTFGISLLDKEMNDFFENLIDDTVKYRKETGKTRNDFLQLMINIKDKDENISNETHHSTITSEESDSHQDEKDKELFEGLQKFKDNKGNSFKFTDKALVANSFVFVSGGSESTASVTAFALYELAANPDIQEKLRDEILKALPNKNVDHSALASVSYFDQVINETLRIYPPFADIQRLCVEDYTIPGTNDVIKKGDELVIPLGAIQMDPKYFPDPEKFDPDRFEDLDSIEKGTYLPFGAGPRFCIGMRLAILEIKVFIAKILMLYNVKISSKTRLPIKMENSVFKKVKGGLWLDFEQRN